MDLLRRIFDIPLDKNEDYRYRMNPKDDPSGRYDADNFSGCYGGGPHNGGGNYQPGGYGSYDDTFRDFHGLDMTPPPPGPPQHYMPSVFGQMDEMFRHLDTMMQGMHLGPGQGAGIQGAVITEIEEETADSGRNPRDAMLKNPDGSSQRTPAAPPAAPYHHHPQGPVNPPHQYEGGDEFANFGAFGAFGGFGKVMDPFRMMEDFFRVFEGRPAIPHLPGPDQAPIHPRDSAVKKDTDLDDSAPCGMGHLLDEGPKYEGPVAGSGKQGDCDGNNPQTSAGPQQQQQQPGGGGAACTPKQPEMQTRFHSTSVIRVRKPDGSIEETRKYRDHTGREEVTVQRKEADELTPGVIQPGDDMPSMFSRGFRWW